MEWPTPPVDCDQVDRLARAFVRKLRNSMTLRLITIERVNGRMRAVVGN